MRNIFPTYRLITREEFHAGEYICFDVDGFAIKLREFHPWSGFVAISMGNGYVVAADTCHPRDVEVCDADGSAHTL